MALLEDLELPPVASRPNLRNLRARLKDTVDILDRAILKYGYPAQSYPWYIDLEPAALVASPREFKDFLEAHFGEAGWEVTLAETPSGVRAIVYPVVAQEGDNEGSSLEED